MKNVKVTPEQREALTRALYHKRHVKTGYLDLDENDERRTRVCSNSRSQHCPGHKAVASRGNKIYCQVCQERTNKKRGAIVRAADEVVNKLVQQIIAGEADYEAELAKLQAKPVENFD